MSLYNLIYGRNRVAELLLPCVGLDPDYIPRYRDCSLSEDNSQLIVLTRTGGGNRVVYVDENNKLVENENFSHDCDAEFDCTYAEFYFNIPSKWMADITKIEDNDLIGTSQEFKELIAKELPQHYKAFFEKKEDNTNSDNTMTPTPVS
ncbi:hypothetical protein QJ857_gp0687 [Tupanvirus soda lake]|uniref:Uncharacterized protein n=2 Tax=Tupanvirus TaxID=2094720 RepID=A0A6N1NLC5_9VIRU|nr:hypothetical protein QJ857_gp0687 [Tupanvirus soda lake]QKU35359.1 hypothetical protein [Tupanvirus soda lake]